MKNSTKILALILFGIALSRSGQIASDAATRVQAKQKADEINSLKAADTVDVPKPSEVNADTKLSWLNTYLSYKIPATAIRSLKAREKPEYEFKLHPYEALLMGSVSTDLGEIPIQISISLKKKCAWLMKTDIAFPMLLEETGQLVHTYIMIQVEELLDASKAFEQSYTELTTVPTYDSDEANIIDQSIEQYLVMKIANGFTVRFKKPEEKTLFSKESALLTVESEQHMLNMLKARNYDYSMNIIASDSAKLLTKDHVITVPYIINSSRVRLWEQNIESTEWVDGKWATATPSGREIVNSQGIPVYMSFNMDSIELEFALQSVSFLPVEQCDKEVGGLPGELLQPDSVKVVRHKRNAA